MEGLYFVRRRLKNISVEEEELLVTVTDRFSLGFKGGVFLSLLNSFKAPDNCLKLHCHQSKNDGCDFFFLDKSRKMKMKFFWNPKEKKISFHSTKRQTISFGSQRCLVSAFNSASSPKEINQRIPPDRQLFLPQWVFFITCTSPRHTRTHTLFWVTASQENKSAINWAYK